MQNCLKKIVSKAIILQATEYVGQDSGCEAASYLGCS